MKCECHGCVARIGKASHGLVCHGIRLLPKPKSSPCKSRNPQGAYNRGRTRRSRFSIGLRIRRHCIIRDLRDQPLISGTPVLIFNSDQFSNLSHRSDSACISQFGPIMTDMPKIGLPIIPCRSSLDVVFLDLQTLRYSWIHGFIQTSIDGVMSAKDRLHEIRPRVEHSGKQCPHLSQHLSKMLSAVRARNACLKEIQPLRNKLFFRRCRLFWVQSCNRVKGHPPQRTPDGGHCSTKRNHS